LKIYQNNFFNFLKINFDISASNWSEKKILIWSKEKNKKFQSFSKALLKYKNKQHYKTRKNWFIKIVFQTLFFNGPHNIKRSLMCYQTPYCVFCTTNTKIKDKQTDF
jgi:hypothetical protein